MTTALSDHEEPGSRWSRWQAAIRARAGGRALGAARPIFTTKAIGAYAGLGLSITYSIEKKHGGQLLLDAAAGGGTTVTIVLPLSKNDAD